MTQAAKMISTDIHGVILHFWHIKNEGEMQERDQTARHEGTSNYRLLQQLNKDERIGQEYLFAAQLHQSLLQEHGTGNNRTTTNYKS